MKRDRGCLLCDWRLITDKTRVGQHDARDKEKQIANMTDDG
jgi:hypothetical protein